MKAGLNIHHCPAICLPGLIQDLTLILHGIMNLLCVRVQVDEVAAQAEILALLPIVNQDYAHRALTVTHSLDHPTCL